MKTIAFYLPQFHTIPENDEWWGKGFTEWTNVKKAESLFDEHCMPEIPLNNNYYDLTNIEVMIDQAKLARKYGIYGFCFYHYWFSGKLLLEKPLENMLKDKNVDIPFCLCWANEHWSRNWDGHSEKLLIAQNYDETKIALENHFYYLLKFFKDSRYIKVHNKPMLIIYKPYLIRNCDNMIFLWNKLARENGFDGIYFGYQYPESFQYNTGKMGFDFGIKFEPLFTDANINKVYLSKIAKINYAAFHWKWAFDKLANKIRRLETDIVITDYDSIWNNILDQDIEANIMPGAFTSWDNTPRRGRKAHIFWKASPQKFKKYFTQLVKKYKNSDDGDLYIFINAWNEWGEGAHLEPDERYGYAYLEAVRDALIENDAMPKD